MIEMKTGHWGHDSDGILKERSASILQLFVFPSFSSTPFLFWKEWRLNGPIKQKLFIRKFQAWQPTDTIIESTSMSQPKSINQRDLLPQKLPFLDLTESASIRCMKTACSIGFLLKLNEESVCFFIVGSLNSSWYPWGKHFLCVPQRRGLCHYVTGNILVSKPDALDEKNNQIRFFDEIWFPIYVSPIDQWPV